MEYTCAGKVERVVPSTTFSSIVARSCPSTKDNLPDFCPSGKDKFQRCMSFVGIAFLFPIPSNLRLADLRFCGLRLAFENAAQFT